MKVLEKGFQYSLETEGVDNPPVFLPFVKKKENKFRHLEVVEVGTTNEEVIEAVLHRLRYLDDQLSCKENKKAIKHLEGALNSLNKRTLKRIGQNIEGTRMPHRD